MRSLCAYVRMYVYVCVSVCVCVSTQAHGVLLSTDGPYDNVIKMKPPLVFDTQHVDILVTTLRRV